MKKVKMLTPLFLLFLILYVYDVKAYTWEIGFKTMGSTGLAMQEYVTVYTFNSYTGDFDFYIGGTTSGQFDQYGYNGYADIGDISTPDRMFSLEGGNNYIIRIGNKYVRLTWPGGSAHRYGDIFITYQSGATESMSCGSDTSDYSISPPYTWSEKTITLKNDFGNDRNNPNTKGNIHFNSMTLTNIGYSDTTLTREAGTFPHTAAGEDNQLVNSYYRKWRNWSEDNKPEISRTLSPADNYSYTAHYAKQVNAAISLNPSGSTITMNGNTITGSQYMYEDLSYTFAAANQVSSTWISYTFDHWIHDGVTVTNNIIPINNPSSGHSLAAYFIGTALPDPMNIHFSSLDGQYIKIEWKKHPDSGVTQYQVWRSVTGGSTGPIATLNQGDTTFTDYQYVQNASGVTKLFYTVKAYYAPSGTWNDPGYILNRGDGTPQPSIANNNNNQLNELGKETPAECSIDNYPNPFNPTTTIDYQLPEEGFVTIKVFDILGKEVTTLVNENKSAGYYRVNFDASKLTSGVYIYTINANGFTQSKKMLLMK